MPITINCTCGKVFKVKDEAAGTPVTCQICGRELIAGQDAPAEFAPLPLGNAATVASAPVAPAPVDVSVAKTKTCPGCAEQIPAKFTLCPMCGESVGKTLEPEEYDAALAQMRTALAAHVDNSDAMEKDAAMKGGSMAVKTIVLIAIFGLCMVMLIAGLTMRRGDGEGLVVMGIMFGVIFAIPVIVSWLNDTKANHIQDAATPALALTNYLVAVKTGRAQKAYAALVPPGRKSGLVETIKYKGDIPHHNGRFTISDLASYKAYWKTIFTGPSGQNRTVAVKNIKTLREDGDTAVVEAEFATTNYPGWIVITFLISLLVVLILILVMQKKESKKVRKLLIKKDGLWFIADPSLEGLIDRAS